MIFLQKKAIKNDDAQSNTYSTVPECSIIGTSIF